MPRVETTTGEVLNEIIAPRILTDWNAVTNGGDVHFYMARLISIDGLPVAQENLPNILIVSIQELLTRSFPIVIGQDEAGADIIEMIPVSKIFAAMKSGFATLFDEKVGELPTLIEATNEGLVAGSSSVPSS